MLLKGKYHLNLRKNLNLKSTSYVNRLGVDRLSAWPIIGADIKHFTD